METHSQNHNNTYSLLHGARDPIYKTQSHFSGLIHVVGLDDATFLICEHNGNLTGVWASKLHVNNIFWLAGGCAVSQSDARFENVC